MIREIRLILKIWKLHEKEFKDLPAEQQERKFHKAINEFNEAKAKYIKTRYAKRYKYEPLLKEEIAKVIIVGLNLLKYPEFYERVAVKNAKNTHEGVQHDDK